MDHQTRAFLALVGEETTALIAAALAERALSSTELAKATQTDPRVLTKHLEAMRLSALVSSHRRPGRGSGRPPIYWQLANTELVEELAEFVRQIRHRLIDAGN
jgi:DNA-binding HxlR family transcriptional regulator